MSSNNEFYYRKVGRKYVKIGSYSDDWDKTMPFGCHVTHCYEHGQSTRYKIDPDIAPLVAAAMIMQQELTDVIMEAGKLQYPDEPEKFTQEQSDAWEHLQKVLGKRMLTLRGPSYADISNKVLDTMIHKADVMMQNPAVKQAYDEFITLCKLVENENT